MNRTLHIMALTALRHGGETRAYYDRKTAAGKTKMEAMRCLKRRLSNIVYARMSGDAQRLAATPADAAVDTLANTAGAGPGGQPGATLQSSAADSHPDIDSSDQSLPGPAISKPRTVLVAAS